jgi:hypothetical protein
MLIVCHLNAELPVVRSHRQSNSIVAIDPRPLCTTKGALTGPSCQRQSGDAYFSIIIFRVSSKPLASAR